MTDQDADRKPLAPAPDFWTEWENWQAWIRWRAILEMAQQEKHVSDDILAELVRQWGVPNFARVYVASRLKGAPPVRPSSPPLDPLFPEWVRYHFDPGQKCRRAEEASMFRAVADVWKRARRYRTFETKARPRQENRPHLRYIRSQGVWRVRSPKARAREKVGGRLNISERALKNWETKVRAWQRNFTDKLSPPP